MLGRFELLDEVELYDLNARYYDPSIARFLTEDPYYNLGNRVMGVYEINVPDVYSIMQANALYAYCGNNPFVFIDISGLEKIVVSGGNDGQENFSYNFIETAIKQINDWQSQNDNEQITWMVANWNYSETDLLNFEKVAEDYGVDFIIINDKQELFDYINTKDGNREDDLITQMAFLSHGTAFDTNEFVNEGHENDYAVALGLAKESNNDLNIFSSDLYKINPNSFAKNNFTFFGSCRTGAEFNGKIFAQEWANVTKGLVKATSSRTSYYNIYPDDRSLYDKILNKISGGLLGAKSSRTIARAEYGFSVNGSINYPNPNGDGTWAYFKAEITKWPFAFSWGNMFIN